MKHIFLFIVCLLCSIRLYSQSDNSKLFYDFFIVNTTSPYSKTIVSKRESLELICFPDSVPPKSWFDLQYDTISISIVSTGINYDSICVENEWASTIDPSELMVLTVINYSNKTQFFCSNSNVGMCNLKRAAIYLEAKSIDGRWINVPNSDISENIQCGNWIQGYGALNIICRKPEHIQSKELRFKMLINSPPNWPSNKYIYSNVFKFN